MKVLQIPLYLLSRRLLPFAFCPFDDPLLYGCLFIQGVVLKAIFYPSCIKPALQEVVSPCWQASYLREHEMAFTFCEESKDTLPSPSQNSLLDKTVPVLAEISYESPNLKHLCMLLVSDSSILNNMHQPPPPPHTHTASITPTIKSSMNLHEAIARVPYS